MINKIKECFVKVRCKITELKLKVKSKYQEVFEKCHEREECFDSVIVKTVSPFITFFDKYKYFLCGLIILVLSLFLKYSLVPYYSNDYYRFIQPWIYQMHITGGGISSLIELYKSPMNPFEIPEIGFNHQVPGCDYPPLYMYVLSIIACLPTGAAVKGFGKEEFFLTNYLYSVKSISFLFDCLLALFAYKIVKKVTDSKNQGIIAFTIILLLPTANVNSALWGQCDAIYAFMVVASIYYIMQGKQVKSMILFGLSLSLKLQGIFIIPLFGFLWFRKSFRLRYMLIVPLTMLVTFLPLWFFGASFDLPFNAYLKQLTEYKALNLNSTSIYALFNIIDNSEAAQKAMSNFAMLLTIIVCFITILSLSFRKTGVSYNSILTISTFFAIIVPFLLPHMHERYFYLADIIFVIYACTNYKRIHLPLLMQLSSIIAISCYGIICPGGLFSNLSSADNLKIGVLLNFVSIVFLIYDLIKLPKVRIVELKE